MGITPSHKSNELYYEQPLPNDIHHHQNELNHHHQQPQQQMAHKQQRQDPALNGHVPQPRLNPPAKLQQWVSLAKQPKFNAMGTIEANMEKEKRLAQQQKMRQKAKMKTNAKKMAMPKAQNVRSG